MDPVTIPLLVGGATVATMAAIGVGTIAVSAVAAGAAVKGLRNKSKNMKLKQEQTQQAAQQADLENKFAMGQRPNQSSFMSHSPQCHQPPPYQQAPPPALPYGGYHPYAAPPMVPYYGDCVPVQHVSVQYVPTQLAPYHSGYDLSQRKPQLLGGLGQQYPPARPTSN